MNPVVVVGAGPAGISTAIGLRDKGLQCLLINEQKDIISKPGESLSPNSTQGFNLWDFDKLLSDSGYPRYTGNTVAWGAQELRSRHFFSEPNGNGWHIDRVKFEQELCQMAEQRGVIFMNGYTFRDLNHHERELSVEIVGPGRIPVVVLADYIVDCSGRSSVVAKANGVKRQTIDRLVAYYFFLDQALPFLKGTTFIEAVEDGWWHAAPAGERQTVVSFMTDSDLRKVSADDFESWLFGKLNLTVHLHNQLGLSAPSDLSRVFVKTAATSFLKQPCGNRWLAVGDAICTYDPLTSFGVTAALHGGKVAAHVIYEELKGNEEPKKNYVNAIQKTFNKSVMMLKQQYAIEQRWMNSPFWQRRH
jgi:flavin-dependent dehydrogenase